MMSISDIHLFTEIELNTHADVKQCVTINSGEHSAVGTFYTPNIYVVRMSSHIVVLYLVSLDVVQGTN